MQAAAKQFRGDFFVAIDQPVGKFVRIEAPFLNGDVGVRGDAIAMPAVRNGRKGLVIRLVKLDADSLGIPIQEQTKELSVEEEDDDGTEEFDNPQATVASPVSAAVAKSIRSASSAADRAQPVKLMAAVPQPVSRSPSQPTRLEDLDDEAREAANEFADQSTRASELSADLARRLAETVPAAAAAAPHTVRRTPESGVPKLTAAEPAKPDPTPPPDDDAGLDSAFGGEPEDPKEVHAKLTTRMEPLEKIEPAMLDSLTADDDRSNFGDERTVARQPTSQELAALAAKTKPTKADDEQADFGQEQTVARVPTPEELANLTPQARRPAIVTRDQAKLKDIRPEAKAVPQDASRKDEIKDQSTDVERETSRTVSAPATPNRQLIILIILIVLAAAAGIALWQGVV